MYENIRVPPPPLIKYKCSFYFGSTYTWLNLIYYSIIFWFTDNSDVVSQTANCDFLGYSSMPNRIPSRNLPQAGLNLVAPQIFYQCDIDASLKKLQEHHQ